MASLTLITIAHVLAIWFQTCKSEIPGLPLELPNHQYPAHNSIVYVPVCSPECAKSSYHQHHLIPNCQEKQHSGSLALEHSHVGLHQQASYGSSHGTASVHQRIHPHGSEHSHTIHHKHGTSQLSFQQEHDGHENHGHGHENHGHGHENHGYGHEEHGHDHHKKNVQYKFEYSVNDHKTGDVKHHKEERKGDEVNGEYSLLEPDGNVRTVKYYADWKSGFHAQIHNSKKSLG